MKILADTNIFIDFWNNSTESLKNVFIKKDIAICGVVWTELLHEAVSAKDFSNITTMFEAFDEFNLEIPDWQIWEIIYTISEGKEFPYLFQMPLL